ncbi:hypothetical protein [Nibrella viscosa]
MKTLAYFLFFLAIIFACSQTKQRSEGESNDTDSTTIGKTATSERQASVPLSFTATRLTGGKNQAQGLYTAYTNQVKPPRVRNPHLCPTVDTTLKYGRFEAGTIQQHLQIVEANLRKLEPQFDGIRIYPCIFMGRLQYILVFTELIPNTDRAHRDKQNKYFRMVVGNDNAPNDFDWCWLHDHVHLQKERHLLSSHKLCSPNCPQGEQPSLSF